MRQKIYLPLIIVLSLFSFYSFSQTGEIKGKVVDKNTKDGIPFASVAALIGGAPVQATVTDIDGNYTIKPLNPAKYDVKATCVGYSPAQINGVLVTIDKISFADIDLGKGVEIKQVEVVDYKIPLIDKGQTATQKTVAYEEIQAAPVRDVNSIASQSAGVFQKDEGEALNVRGSRSDATSYYVDGVKVRGSSSVAQKGAEQITVITGGIPAQYGDATGGIISITTRGPSKQYTGGVEVQSSKPFDSFDNNVVSFDLSGPIITKRDSVGRKSGQPIAGFFIAGDYNYDGDPDPSAIGAWKIKDDILDDIRKNPLIKSTNGAGFDKRAAFLTKDSMDFVKARQNVLSKGFTLNAKLDIKPVKSVDLIFGGSYNESDHRNYTDIYSLMNYDNNAQTIDDTWRVYGRITQRFGSDENQAKSASAIKNAYYSIQADYSKNLSVTQNDKHKDNIFDYGYLGKFTTNKKDLGLNFIDTIFGSSGQVLYVDTFPTYFLQLYDSGYTFQPSDLNENTANYTSQYYALAPGMAGYYDNSSEVVQNGGLLNGDNRIGLNVYGLWATPGRVQNFYGKSDASQFRISASGSADIKNHNLVVGMEYEQREDRSYNVAPSSLWSLMRALANNTILQGNYDYLHPIVSVGTNGDTTITYQHVYNPTQAVDTTTARGFYENVRDAFGVGYHDFVDIDNYLPSQYNLNMFAPDELLLNGLVGYYGYDYLGNKTTSNPSLADFFKNKDSNGNFSREIGPFQPIYVAGYIQDKFTFNDLIFNIGLRVDRFDANQKILSDKYLLYSAYTANSKEAKSLAGTMQNYSIPSNIKEDYVVYVNDYNNPTAIVGYRNGDKWYDSQGTQITDVSPLTQTAGNSTGSIQPYIINKKAATDKDLLEDNLSGFGDYDPQTTFMPRIAFSFPISDEAYFAAHYEVLTQRPQNSGLIRFNPLTYYNLSNGLGGNVANPDLKPERTTQYEITFQQKLSPSSAFSLSAFYKELRDMIQIINVSYAFPIDYSTYGNIDFGTVKGLTFAYDLRRTGNVRLNASYTLQFADGTGSNETTNAGLLATQGQTNLRESKPLDFDQRHTLVASVDYHYQKGKNYDGPVWFNKQVFSDAGFNIVFRTGSGTPYTRQNNITPTADFTSIANSRSTVSGQVNGSRLPWQFRVDAKVDKSFDIKFGKKANGESRRPLSMNVYLQVLNVFDAENIQAVYRATGSPSDDGYLSSAIAQTLISTQLSPQAYIDQYRIAENNLGNYSLPRRIRLGIQLNF